MSVKKPWLDKVTELAEPREKQHKSRDMLVREFAVTTTEPVYNMVDITSAPGIPRLNSEYWTEADKHTMWKCDRVDARKQEDNAYLVIVTYSKVRTIPAPKEIQPEPVDEPSES